MDTNTVVSVCSAIIALAALFVAAWEAHATRRHNRLAVTPHLTFTARCSDKSPRFLVELENTGLGPARIRRFTVFLDGKEQKLFEAGAWLAIADLLELKGRTGGIDIDEGEFYPVGLKHQVIRYDGAGEKERMATIRHAFQRVAVEIDYDSVYGEHYQTKLAIPVSIFDCFETDSRDL